MRATDLAVSSLTDGHLEVFAISAAGRLRHRWYWREAGWSDWTDMPAPAPAKAASTPGSTANMLTAIAAGTHSDRHQEIFALGSGGDVYHAWNWLKDNGSPNWEAWSEWSPWHEMPPVR